MESVVPIKNGINFRDLGGIKTVDGRTIRKGLLYRSGSFTYITPEEGDFLADNLQLHYVLDYRDQSEVDTFPNKLWKNVNYINIPANPLSDEVTAAITQELTSDAKQLKDHYPIDFMVKLYQLLPFNNPAYKKLASLLLQNDNSPLVQHCAVGKDRTGVGVALTLFALGVDEETVMQDYLFTETALADFREKLLQKIKDRLSPEVFENRKEIFAAKREYLAAAITAIKDRYQTIDNWLAKEYQLDAEKRKIIQENYLI
ncbi:tyrosine-protein phosphatase [Orbaceae bacterium ESL0721]|nr:tyrosine-protein phosphatase [Orbaceae bacterium ESL0721]